MVLGMAWSAVVAGAALEVAFLLACQSAFAQSAGQQDPGPDPQTSFGPVEPSQRYTGALEELSDVDMFNLRLASGPASLGVEVSHTNDVCEIWARLVDQRGIQSQEVFVPRAGTARLQTIAPGQGPYYIEVSSGPLRSCAGATYALEIFVQFLPLAALDSPDPLSRRMAARAVASELGCYAACLKAAEIGTRLRKLVKRLHETRGATHVRVARKVRRVKKRYRKARRRSEKICALS
jgi:hypothetical protein